MLVQAVGRKRTVDNLEALLAGTRALYEDEAVLRPMLQQLTGASKRYVDTIRSKDKEKEATDNDSIEDGVEE